jgi:phospholipid transport system substrate-binding protein
VSSLLLTRTSFLAALTATFALTAAPAFAARNPEAEQYVQVNANGALQMLAQRSSVQEREQAFSGLMARFADLPRIATFVLGRYAGQLRADPALRQEWFAVFQDYSYAVYEDQLDRYRGNTITITGSIERTAGQDVVVQTVVVPRGQSRPLPVNWRMYRAGNAWKVVDVSLVLEGNEVWLAQQQQRDFLAQLDRTRGDIRALITSVRAATAQMRARIRARA